MLNPNKNGPGAIVLDLPIFKMLLITSLAFDVTPLEPYMSCGQLINKAQRSALSSLVPNAI